MATHRVPASIVRPEAGVETDLIRNQITAVAAPAWGDLLCLILSDAVGELGAYVEWEVPQNYIGTTTDPSLIPRGVIDGAPGASDVLGFTFQKRAVADNEGVDAALDAAELGSATIGSGGVGYANEDLGQVSISLDGTEYAVGDLVGGILRLDTSVTTYAGQFLWLLQRGLWFEYDDV